MFKVSISNSSELIEYMKNDGHTSRPQELKKCLDNAVVADFLYSPSIWGERSLHCVIRDDSLSFNINGRVVNKKDIFRIDISHHFSYDTVSLRLRSGNVLTTNLEDHEIIVMEGDGLYKYSFAKIQTILIGK